MADDVALDDVYRRAGEALRIVEVSEPLSAEDRAKFAERYPAVYALLEGRGLAQWGETDPVPQRYVEPVVDLLAQRAAPVFHTQFDASWALPELTRQVSPDYRYDEVNFLDF